MFRLAPGMTCERRDRARRDAGIEVVADAVEDRLEDRLQGEDGRPSVDSAAAGLDLAHLAARRAGPLDHGHIEAARGQDQGGHEAGHARPDDGDPVPFHPSRPKGPALELSV